MKKVFVPEFIRKHLALFRKDGFTGLLRKGGFKLLIIFFLFYLIRDTILYVIPFLLAANAIHACN